MLQQPVNTPPVYHHLMPLPTAAAAEPATPLPPQAEGSTDPPKRRISCLAKTIGSGIDGGIFGAAIGSLMATGPAFSHGLLNGGLSANAIRT